MVFYGYDGVKDDCWELKRSSCSKRDKQRQQAKGPPAFRIWQAKQLYGRDLLIGSCMLLALLCHFIIVVPELCSSRQGPTTAQSSSHSNDLLPAEPSLTEYRPLAVDLICGDIFRELRTRVQSHALALNSVTPSGASAATDLHLAAPVAATIVAKLCGLLLEASYGFMRTAISVGFSACHFGVSVMLHILRAVCVFFGSGFITRDPFHMVMPPLRLCIMALLLLPLPYPCLAAVELASSRRNQSVQQKVTMHARGNHVVWYQPHMLWQLPSLRAAVVVMQRLLPIATAFASVGFTSSPLLHLTALHTRSLLVQYVFMGWAAWMLVVPLRLHVIVNFTEWLLTFFTVIRVRMIHLEEPLGCTSHLIQLLISLLLVFVLPTVGVAALERNYRARYQQLLQAQSSGGDRAAAAGPAVREDKCQGQQQHQQQDVFEDSEPTSSTDKLDEDESCQETCSKMKQRGVRMPQQVKGSQQLDTTQQLSGVDESVMTTTAAATASSSLASTAYTQKADDKITSGTVVQTGSVSCSIRTCDSVQIACDCSSYSSSSFADRNQIAVGKQFFADINSSLQLAAARRPGHPVIGSKSNQTTCLPVPILQQQQQASDDSWATVSEYIPYFYSRSARTTDSNSSFSADSPSPHLLSPDCVGMPWPASSSSSSVVPTLVPTIRSLIGDQQAAAVFAAAAAAAAAGGGSSGNPAAGAVVQYTSMAPKRVCYSCGAPRQM